MKSASKNVVGERPRNLFASLIVSLCIGMTFAKMADDITMRQFVESTWFKGLSRGAMIIVAGVSGYIGATVYGLQTKALAQAAEISAIKATQIERARDSDQFQSRLTRDLGDFQTSVTGDLFQINAKVSTVQQDVAGIRGMLAGMERRASAARWTPYDPMAQVVPVGSTTSP